jgi:hypothetical protein
MNNQIPFDRYKTRVPTSRNIDFRGNSANAEQFCEVTVDSLTNQNTSKTHKDSLVWQKAIVVESVKADKVDNTRFTSECSDPEITLGYIQKLTDDFGIIHLSILNKPDISSGYTLDDNSQALIAVGQYYESTKDEAALELIHIYFRFIKQCLQREGYFLNYMNERRVFTEQNNQINLADANGRALWALGYILSLHDVLPGLLIQEAEQTMEKALLNARNMHSTRAIAFAIKGLYYSNLRRESLHNQTLIKGLANRLVQMYRHEADQDWQWFESYFSYANSILPDALLCAWLATGDALYKEIARGSFDFLLSKTFGKSALKVISRKSWLYKGDNPDKESIGAEHPVDVAMTVLALKRYNEIFKDENYMMKMEASFNWFFGNNHLNEVIYNSITGGCYDGLEENRVNLNQSAESAASYLMARVTMNASLMKEKKMRHSPESLQTQICRWYHEDDLS